LSIGVTLGGGNLAVVASENLIGRSLNLDNYDNDEDSQAIIITDYHYHC